MAHESCKSQIAVLEMNGQSVPQRWTSMREGSNTARRQCLYLSLALIVPTHGGMSRLVLHRDGLTAIRWLPILVLTGSGVAQLR